MTNRTPTTYGELAVGEAFTLLPLAEGEVMTRTRCIKLRGGWYHSSGHAARYLISDDHPVQPVA